MPGWWAEQVIEVVPDGALLTLTGGTPEVDTTAHYWANPTPAVLALTGGQPSVTLSDHKVVAPSSATLTLAGGQPTVTVFGITGIAATNGTSGTIPTHAAGDLIVIFAFARNSTTVPPAPAAGGTVPTWSFVNQGNAGAACVGVVATAVATANNHTTGTWSGADSVTAVVIRGQAASPIGGQAGGGASTLDATAPAVTLSKTDGSSILLHFMGARTGGATVTWGAAPAGYTKRTEITSGGPICVLTKDATTTDGAVTVTRTGGTTGYSGHTIEIIRG